MGCYYRIYPLRSFTHAGENEQIVKGQFVQLHIPIFCLMHEKVYMKGKAIISVTFWMITLLIKQLNALFTLISCWYSAMMKSVVLNKRFSNVGNIYKTLTQAVLQFKSNVRSPV